MDITSLFYEFIDSPIFKLVIVVIALPLILKIFRYRNPKGKTRNSEWLLKRLEKERFSHWWIFDLLIFFASATVTVTGSFLIINFINLQIIPTNVDFVFSEAMKEFYFSNSIGPIGIFSFFLGIALSVFISIPITKRLLHKRYKKYVLYTIAKHGYDPKRLEKWAFWPFFISMIFLAALASRTYIAVVDQSFVQQRMFSISKDSHHLENINEIYFVENITNMAGKVRARTHLVLEFENEQIWSSWKNASTMEVQDLINLSNVLHMKTGIKPKTVDFYPE